MQESILYLSKHLAHLDRLLRAKTLTNTELAYIFDVGCTEGRFFELRKHLISCGILVFMGRRPNRHGTAQVDYYSIDHDNIGRLVLTHILPNLGEMIDGIDWRGLLGNSLPLKQNNTMKNIDAVLSDEK